MLTSAITLALLGWWATNKVALIALRRATWSPNLPFLSYAAVLLLPVLPARVSSAARVTPSALRHLFHLALHCCVLAAVVASLALGGVEERTLLRNGLYALGLYSLLAVLMDGSAALAGCLLGLSFAKHFDAPFLASSHADFWGRRWNLTAGGLLRLSVYDPVCEGRLLGATPAPPGPVAASRRALALCLTFLASGVAHELILLRLNWPAWPSLSWLAYFTVQGPILLAEARLKRAIGGRIATLPAILLTLSIQLLLGSLLFIPPCVRSGLAARVVASLRSLGTWSGFAVTTQEL